MRLEQTPSQTVGPFFAYGLTPEQYGYPFRSLAGSSLVDDDTPGMRIRITGRVLDGDGAPVPDAMIEIWQADALGRYAHPADPRGSNLRFKGFGRCGTGTDPENRFVFDTIKPGLIGDGQAPHVNVSVLMRGLLSHVFTRIYFADEAEANAGDPVLASVEEARRGTLIAARETTPAGTVYRLDLHMQGPDETVFFDV
ncbi:MAG: protocatechuate 3,4-dioxygenase subunit alpha [Geminicoccaceae bacterium]